MTYYSLVSPYEGDTTKNCGLTIEEVDANFFELEKKLYDLTDSVNSTLKSMTDELDDLQSRVGDLENRNIVLSMTMHDADICKPGTSNDALYEVDRWYTMYVSGKIDYSGDVLPDGSRKGNRFGVAIMPVYEKQQTMFPDVTWSINGINMGSLWEEIATNPKDWETALYLYPKVERIDDEVIVSLAGKTNNDNTLTVSIEWSDDNVETYTYIVSEDVELEKVYSRTVHDTEICEPGTSNKATYTLNPEDDHIMTIGGTIYYNTEVIPGTDVEKGYRFGVAIQPLYDTTEETYPDATWAINGINMGSLWEEIATNPKDWATALYLYPKVERIYDGYVVSLAGHSDCTNSIDITINWNNENSETYKYIVSNDIDLIKE